MRTNDAFRILGCPCIPIASVDIARKLVTAIVTTGANGYSVAINAEKVMAYRRNARLRQAIDDSLLPYPDGAGAVLALKWLYREKSVKLDLPQIVLDLADENRWRLFVLGSEEEVNNAACGVIRKVYPHIELVGRLNGFEREERVLDSIGKTSPQLVLAGLGSPKQELMACRIRTMLPQTFLIGCGGALDVLAGRMKRAPRFMINNNLEWLYRLYKQPSRWTRQRRLVDFFLFVGVERFLGPMQLHEGQ